ncbi:hypothetical protein [Hymenobacter arcticus]
MQHLLALAIAVVALHDAFQILGSSKEVGVNREVTVEGASVVASQAGRVQLGEGGPDVTQQRQQT